MANEVRLSLDDLLSDIPSDDSKTLPSIADLAKWRIRLSREGHPQGSESPLKDVYEQLEAAGDLPEPQPYQAPAEPLLTLTRRIYEPESFAETPVELPAPLVSTVPAATPAPQPAPAQANPLATLLGQEVLAMVSSRELSATSRTEAVEATLMALENPTVENVRAILRALLRD